MSRHCTGSLKAIAAALLLLAGAIGFKAFRVYRNEAAAFSPGRWRVDRPPPEPAFEGMKDVIFHGAGDTVLRGWMLPGRNGAAVILADGSVGDRRQLLPEARILSKNGYGILMFDWPGHGESGGTVVWGEPERRALEAAVDFVGTESGVDRTRLGALGFSMGGAIVAQVAARDSRLRAVVLEATFTDAAEQLRFEYGRFGLGFLMQWPARLADQLAGMDVPSMRPIDTIAALRPRPVLMIAGGADDLVPAWMVQRLYDAAGEPKQMWTIPKARHGGYNELEPEDYGNRLRGFFDTTLGLNRDGSPLTSR